MFAGLGRLTGVPAWVDCGTSDPFAPMARRLRGQLTGVPAWVDCGTSDPFAPMARRLRGRLHPGGQMGRGCHDGAFWLRRPGAELAFLGAHLNAPADHR